MRKLISFIAAASLVVSLVGIAACSKAKKADPLIGTWALESNPSKVIKIYKEGDQFIYEGSQGKTPATRKDANTLVAPMGPIEVTIALDPESGVLNISFMGEKYTYKKAP